MSSYFVFGPKRSGERIFVQVVRESGTADGPPRQLFGFESEAEILKGKAKSFPVRSSFALDMLDF